MRKRLKARRFDSSGECASSYIFLFCKQKSWVYFKRKKEISSENIIASIPGKALNLEMSCKRPVKPLFSEILSLKAHSKHKMQGYKKMTCKAQS